MKTHVAIVGVAKYKNKILILKRSPRKRYSPGLWEFVGGFLHEAETTEHGVLREVKEETGLKGRVERRGNAFESTDAWSNWIVIPHLVIVNSNKVKRSKEHTEYRWILPKEIDRYKCVVNARKDLENVGLL